MVLQLNKTFKSEKKPSFGEQAYIHKTGWAQINDFITNKGQAFSIEERASLGLEGLLPPRILSLQQQRETVLAILDGIQDSLGKYTYLRDLQDSNETLFYHCLLESADRLLPIVYTPVVGLACQNYSIVHRRPRGLFISFEHRGRIEQVLKNWPFKNVKAIVVTDGERILGLGDLGANGMGIPVGKMALYTVFGGIKPQHCLPITLDVGTNNEEFQKGSVKYVGSLRPRLRGEQYERFVDEFMEAVVKVFGRNTFIQFEDFSSVNAFKFLARYRQQYTMMNDDIQGTAAVAVAGLLTASRFSGKDIASNTVLFVGAGQAGVGIANLMVMAMGGDPKETRKKIFFKRSNKLVVKGDEESFDIDDDRRLYCHEVPDGADVTNLVKIIEWLKPNILIGVSGTAKLFTPEVLKTMAEVTEHPVILPLSNPTERSECSAEEAYTHTGGRCLFASGSPFLPVEVDGTLRKPQQCNNLYIFPGVALAATTVGMTSIPDEVFLIATKTLATKCVEQCDIEQGSLFPNTKNLRNCSIQIACDIIDYAYEKNIATLKPRPADIKEYLHRHLYNPHYTDHCGGHQ